MSNSLLDAFKNRFTSSSNPGRNIDLSFLPTFVSQQDQEKLLLPLIDEEIKDAFFNMNRLKSS